MGKRILEMIITGDAKSAMGALKEVEGGTDGMGSKLAGAGQAAAIGLAAVGAVAVGVALKSASTFESVGLDVAKFQRYTGASAEDASRLRNVFAEVGMDADTAGKNMGIFSKKIVGSKDPMKDFGFATKDANGHLLPMADLLGNAADKFSKMPDGPEKTAEALKLFGKGGADMIKILDKGKDGIAALSAETDKYGLVLSQDQVDAAKKAALAHREMGLALQGVGVAIGQYVLPIVTTVVRWFADEIPKAMKAAKAWIADHMDVISRFRQKMLDVFDWVKKFVVETVFPALKTALSDAAGIIQDVTKFLQDHHEVLIAVAAVIGGVLVAAFAAWAIGAAQAAIATFAATWPIIAVAAAIGVLVAGLLYAYNHWKWFHDAVDKSVAWLKTNVPPVWELIKTGAQAVFGWLKEHVPPIWDKILEAVKKFADWFTNTAWPAIVQVFDSFKQGLGVLVGFVQDHWKQISSAVSSAWDLIKNLISNAFDWIKTGWSAFNDLIHGKWGDLWKDIQHLVEIAWDVIKNVVSNGWDLIKNVFVVAKDFISNIGSTMWDGIKDGFRSAINWVIDQWNGLSISLPQVDTPFGSWGGGTVDFPNIPRLHTGGYYTAPRGESEGLAMLKTGERVMPVSDSQPTPRQTPTHVQVQPTPIVIQINGRELARAMTKQQLLEASGV